MVTNELKQRVIAALAEQRVNFSGTDKKFATSKGLNPSAYNRIKNGETERVIADSIWISLARKLEVPIGNIQEWKTAETPVYKFIMSSLAMCQINSASRLLCDIPDIGKTFSARAYVKQNRNAVYVDCSQNKTRQKLIRAIAKEFGVGYTGRIGDVYEDLVFYLRSLPNPLIILDEAGDLEYNAFLELKALWNATERCVGWYMMGADGLKHKIRKSIDAKKVGYAELFSRFGSRYLKLSPDGSDALKEFKTIHAAVIIKANMPNANGNIQTMIVGSDYSLRRIETEIRKHAGLTV